MNAINSPPVIELQQLSKVFSTKDMDTFALSGVELQVHANEFVSIEGPSGCGKSTLLSIVGLLEPPTTGKYLLNGHDSTQLGAAERTRLRNQEIGFIFQNFNLIGDLTVYDNVELPLAYRGVSVADRRPPVEEALDRVGMSHRSQHFPAQLSGGQQQRVAVARAIAGKPKLLLADEPTGNLDSTHGAAVMELLRQLHQSGATVCMVTHDPRYVDYATRTIHLFDGKVAVPHAPELRP